MSHPPRPAPRPAAKPAAKPAPRPAPGAANEAQQHDLADGHATRVVAEARISADDLVLEVGPGLGALTAGLLTAGARVVAIERDPRRIATLRQRFAKQVTDGRLTLVTGDALELMPPMPAPWRVLANPPFALTAPLVRRWLLESDPAPTAIELVLQREAALKLAGSEGGQTRSSIIAHLCGTPQVVRHLPRDAVTPPSRVDLAVWRHRRDAEAPAATELAAVDRLLDTAFAGHHTMQEALRGLATGVQIRRQAAEHGWNPAEHPRTLAPAAWLALTRLLITCGRLQIGRQRRR
jgi:16S rRNA A1518/A1519 N6-dimethyltransferase RsmA/KsgA/DIM1 with predicted DNA glycosylase/AP lyase activity